MALESIDYFYIVASIIGLVIFAYSALKVQGIMNLLPKESKTKTYWLYALGLIFLFMLGYLFSILVIFTNNKAFLDTITPVIYIFGAVFVFIMVTISFRTYKVILESAE